VTLDDFEEALNSARPHLDRHKILLVFHRDPQQYDKASVWAELTTPRRIAQVIVWETGETDITVGSLETGQVVDQRTMTLHGQSQFAGALEQILKLLR
jgi:hypothetical protein